MPFKSVLFSLLMFFLSQAQASLWQATNTWDEAWEKKYSIWITQDVTPTFLKDHSIATDCADAALALRWIFAKQNSLPAASTNDQGKLITHLSSNWDQYPTATDWTADKRFLVALKDLLNSTSSKTLFQDTYPVQLNSKNLVPGTLFINATADSGHVEWIAKTIFSGQQSPIVFYSSTVPQMVREFLVYPFMKVKWPQKNKNGFVRFRWPVMNGASVALKSSVTMPGYHLEQYELEANQKMDFDDFVTSRLIGHPIDGINKLQTLVSHLAERFENRVPVVEQGFKECSKQICKSGSSRFYDYSTYSRDGAITLLIQGIFDLIYSDRYLNVDDQMSGQMNLMWSQLQTDVLIEIQGKNFPMGLLVANWNQALFSSDPNDSIEKRWGLKPN